MGNRNRQRKVTLFGVTQDWRHDIEDTSLATKLGKRITPQGNGCWYYEGEHSNGYAVFNGKGVHRLLYEIVKGDSLPSNMHVHHLCEVRRCVNPAHLLAVPASSHVKAHAVARAEHRNIFPA